MARDSDPTQDPDFQKVVGHFLRTPPKPHKDKIKQRRRKSVDKDEAKDAKKG